MDKNIKNLLSSQNIKQSKNINTEFYGDNVSLDSLISILEISKSMDLMELMCHPAYIDSDLLTLTSYNIKRAEELKILTSNEIKKYIKNNNIELISYREIK